MAADVFNYVSQGYTLVCASSRLARRLKYQYGQLQISQGKKAWPTPDILPWTAWLQRCWHELILGEDRDLILLSAEQQLYVWQQLIQKTGRNWPLLQIPSTARQALAAWNIVRDWRIPVFPEGYYLNEDANAFQAWSAAYGRYCRENGLIDTTDIPQLLLDKSSRAPVMHRIALTGFDDVTPIQQHLLTGLGKAGMKFQVIDPADRNTNVIALGQADTGTEIRAAAIWARRLLISGVEDSIGIVARDLRSLHARIENTFDDVLIPGSILAGGESGLRPYSIAQGTPLNRYPIIKTALDILELGERPVALELLGAVLRSPFTRGADTESQGRAQLDASLRKHGEHRMALNSLEYYAGRYVQGPGVPTVLLSLCRGYLDTLHDITGKRPVQDWAGIFSVLLKRFGWPGERALNSTEYQTLAEWRDLMESFAFLDPAFGTLNYREALAHLRQLAGSTGFQPETPETPVQVMGMTGAAGMQFNHLWVLGLDEGSWPYQADPNPFIPVRLQREAGFPRASADLALAQAGRDTQRLIRSAEDIVLSYPENDKDRPLRPSPLIKKYLTPAEDHTDKGHDYAAILFASRRWVESDDDMAPIIPQGEAVSGGTALFSDQAACPFRACARHRLYAEGVERRDIGLDALERGSIMHEVMQRLWGKLADHASLLAISGAQLDKIINQCVRSVLSAYRKKYPLTFSDNFIRLEAARIGAITHSWLELERERRPFRVIEREYRHRVTLGDISVNTRIDRIDRLEDGRCVIIDYKTGDPNPAAWLGERPDEPQLPLYAISCEGNIAAVVFARLRRGMSAFIGLAQEEGLLPGVTTVEGLRGGDDRVSDWDSLFDAWRNALTQLARDFRHGVARVDPKRTDTCTWCDLHALCRIYDQNTRRTARDNGDD